jgi:heme-degrading monooxygenase HmoA
MITRIWKGRALLANATAYHSFVTQHVFTQLTRLEGHRGAYLLRRDTGDHAEFMAVTLWDSLQSIRAFAGDSLESAVVEPEARAVLSSFDDFVTHYEVVHGHPCAGATP